VGNKARNTYLSSDDFLESISDDDSPFITFFDNCFSGLFAQNMQERPNTIAVSTNTQRTIKPCPAFLPSLFELWADGNNLEEAFKAASLDCHINSFDYLIGGKLSPKLRLLGKRIDDFLSISKSTKQMYSNGIDPSEAYL